MTTIVILCILLGLCTSVIINILFDKSLYIKNINIDDPKIKFNFLYNSAKAYVKWAKDYMIGSSGRDKHHSVCNKVKSLAKDYNINISDSEIEVLVLTAYDDIMDISHNNNIINIPDDSSSFEITD